MKKVTALLVLGMACLCLPAHGQYKRLGDDAQSWITFTNHSKHAIWVTIYSLQGNNLAPGCVEAGTTNTLRNAAFGKSIRQVRILLEVKESATTCANHSNLYTKTFSPIDYTKMQITETSPKDVKLDPLP